MQLSGENKVITVDDEADCRQLIRALQDLHPAPPLWRRQRPQILPDAAHFYSSDSDKGTLTLRYCSLLSFEISTPWLYSLLAKLARVHSDLLSAHACIPAGRRSSSSCLSYIDAVPIPAAEEFHRAKT